MPEGPETRRVADKLTRALVDRPLRRVEFGHAHLAPFARRLRGRTVRRVQPRGKALLIHCGRDLAIYTHSQLYGRWFVRRAGTLPRTTRQLRLALHTEDSSALLYSASEIDVLTPAQQREHPFLRKLGPDVLDAGVDADRVAALLAAPGVRRRGLGGLLLDQGFLGGLGNYLRSEILFEAGLHPRATCGALSGRQRRELAEAIVEMARRGYRDRGVTNDADRVQQLRAEGVPRSRYRHLVFGRAGEHCYRCGETIAREEVAARRLYRCPVCQPNP